MCSKRFAARIGFDRSVKGYIAAFELAHHSLQFGQRLFEAHAIDGRERVGLVHRRTIGGEAATGQAPDGPVLRSDHISEAGQPIAT